jgi:hypothetical protein
LNLEGPPISEDIAWVVNNRNASHITFETHSRVAALLVAFFPLDCKSSGSEKEIGKERLTIVQLIGANVVLGVLPAKKSHRSLNNPFNE